MPREKTLRKFHIVFCCFLFTFSFSSMLRIFASIYSLLIRNVVLTAVKWEKIQVKPWKKLLDVNLVGFFHSFSPPIQLSTTAFKDKKKDKRWWGNRRQTRDSNSHEIFIFSLFWEKTTFENRKQSERDEVVTNKKIHRILLSFFSKQQIWLEQQLNNNNRQGYFCLHNIIFTMTRSLIYFINTFFMNNFNLNYAVKFQHFIICCWQLKSKWVNKMENLPTVNNLMKIWYWEFFIKIQIF